LTVTMYTMMQWLAFWTLNKTLIPGFFFCNELYTEKQPVVHALIRFMYVQWTQWAVP